MPEYVTEPERAEARLAAAVDRLEAAVEAAFAESDSEQEQAVRDGCPEVLWR